MSLDISRLISVSLALTNPLKRLIMIFRGFLILWPIHLHFLLRYVCTVMGSPLAMFLRLLLLMIFSEKIHRHLLMVPLLVNKKILIQYGCYEKLYRNPNCRAYNGKLCMLRKFNTFFMKSGLIRFTIMVTSNTSNTPSVLLIIKTYFRQCFIN